MLDDLSVCMLHGCQAEAGGMRPDLASRPLFPFQTVLEGDPTRSSLVPVPRPGRRTRLPGKRAGRDLIGGTSPELVL